MTAVIALAVTTASILLISVIVWVFLKARKFIELQLTREPVPIIETLKLD